MTRIDYKYLMMMIALIAAFVVYVSNLDLTNVRASSAAAALPANGRVIIENFSFGPAALTIKAGTSVTWVNRDDSPHTIVSKDRRVRSAALDTGDTFTFKFDTPGTFQYFCSVHPYMTGQVVVVQ